MSPSPRAARFLVPPLPEHQCNSIEDYIEGSLMARVGSWGTDLELFLAAQILKTDILYTKMVNMFG